MYKLPQLQETLTLLVKRRGEARQRILKAFSEEFITALKEAGYLSFSRDTLNVAFSNSGLSVRVQQALIKAVITYLVTTNKVRENTVDLTAYSFRSKPLFSMDYGSYSILMQRNGYKRVQYKDEYDLVVASLVGYVNAGRVTGTFYRDSHKPRSAQGCFTNSKLSVVREATKYTRKVYDLVEN